MAPLAPLRARRARRHWCSGTGRRARRLLFVSSPVRSPRPPIDEAAFTWLLRLDEQRGGRPLGRPSGLFSERHRVAGPRDLARRSVIADIGRCRSVDTVQRRGDRPGDDATPPSLPACRVRGLRDEWRRRHLPGGHHLHRAHEHRERACRAVRPGDGPLDRVGTDGCDPDRKHTCALRARLRRWLPVVLGLGQSRRAQRQPGSDLAGDRSGDDGLSEQRIARGRRSSQRPCREWRGPLARRRSARRPRGRRSSPPGTAGSERRLHRWPLHRVGLGDRWWRVGVLLHNPHDTVQPGERDHDQDSPRRDRSDGGCEGGGLLDARRRRDRRNRTLALRLSPHVPWRARRVGEKMVRVYLPTPMFSWPSRPQLSLAPGPH